MNFQKASFFRSFGLTSQLPDSTVPEIVLCGRSNVGKSSLINKLTGRKNLARTSSEPGKTATINFYDIGDAYLVDLPGYGYAKKAQSEKERFNALMGGYFGMDRDIPLVLSLIDIRHEPSKLDISLIEFLIEAEFPLCIVFTKADKLSKTQINKNLEIFSETIPCFEDIHYVVSSSQTGEGIETIKAFIEESLS